MHACFLFWMLLDPWGSLSIFPQLDWTFHRLQLTQNSGFHRNLQLFPRVFDGVLELFIIRIDQVAASQLLRIVELLFVDSPLMLSLSCFRHARSNFWPQTIRSASCLNFCKPQLKHTHILLEVLHLVV